MVGTTRLESLPLSLMVELGDDGGAGIAPAEGLRGEKAERRGRRKVSLAEFDHHFFAKLMNIIVAEDFCQPNLLTFDEVVDTPNHFLRLQHFGAHRIAQNASKQRW